MTKPSSKPPPLPRPGVGGHRDGQRRASIARQNQLRKTRDPGLGATIGLITAVVIFGTASLVLIALIGIRLVQWTSETQSQASLSQQSVTVDMPADSAAQAEAIKIDSESGKPAKDHQDVELTSADAKELNVPGAAPFPGEPDAADAKPPLARDVETDEVAVTDKVMAGNSEVAQPVADDAEPDAVQRPGVAEVIQQFERLRSQPYMPLPAVDNLRVQEKEVALADLSGELFQDLSLQLIGCDIVFGPGSGLEIQKVKSSEQPQWVIRQANDKPGIADQDLATLWLDDLGLMYRWNHAAKGHLASRLLRFCFLRFSLANQTVDCRLGAPYTIPAPPLSLKAKEIRIQIPLTKEDLPPISELLLEVDFDGFAKVTHDDEHTVLRVGDLAKIGCHLENQDDLDNPALVVHAEFEFKDKPTLVLSCFGYPDRFVEGTELEDGMPFSSAELSRMNREIRTTMNTIRKRQASLENQIRVLRTQERSLLANPNGFNSRQQQQQLISARVDQVRKVRLGLTDDLHDLEEQAATIELQKRWYDQVKQLVKARDDLQRVQIRLFVKEGDHEVEIARTNQNGDARAPVE